MCKFNQRCRHTAWISLEVDCLFLLILFHTKVKDQRKSLEVDSGELMSKGMLLLKDVLFSSEPYHKVKQMKDKTPLYI